MKNKILIVTILLINCICHISAQTVTMDIWEGTANSNVHVKLTSYLAPGNNNTAIIVCPGGSYFWLDKETEGDGVAKWLQANGISAFVLEYRVAGVPAFITHNRLLCTGHRFPQAIQDLQRSIQIVRERASEYGINPNKIGAMGFSAGGHLVASAGIYHNTDFLRLVGINTSTSLCPNFVAPIYPVVTFTDKCMHKRSRRGLLGEGKSINKTMCDSLSLEKHVRHGMPPVFLMNCKDDPIVKYRNSELLDSALTSAKVPHKYIQYNTGGHGFGANPKKTSHEAIAWCNEFINWLKSL